MRLLRALAVEFGKAATLPAVWIGVAVTVLGTAAVTLLNAVQTARAVRAGTPERYGTPSISETAYAAAPLGTVGAVVIGVVVVSSEYAANSPDAGGGRQIATSCLAVPMRLHAVVAKAVVVLVFVLGTALLAFPACLGISRLALGDVAVLEPPGSSALFTRALGSAVYWTLMGLLATGISLVCRSGVVPLIVLIVNSSVVSVSLLLTNLTPLAHWLPDMAGRNLFGFDADSVVPGGLDVVPGGVVMAAWSVVALVAGAIAFLRRDA